MFIIIWKQHVLDKQTLKMLCRLFGAGGGGPEKDGPGL